MFRDQVAVRRSSPSHTTIDAAGSGRFAGNPKKFRTRFAPENLAPSVKYWSMARVNYTGFDTGDTIEATDSYLASFSSSTRLNSSGYSLQLSPPSDDLGYYALSPIASNGTKTNTATNTSYTKFHIYVTSRPTVTTEIFVIYSSLIGYPQLKLQMTSTGALRIIDASATERITGSVIPLNTWTRIEVYYSTDLSSIASAELKIDGTSQGTSSALDYNFGGDVDQWVLGRREIADSTSYTIYYEDFVVDNAAYPGDTRIVLLTPNANGTFTGWTASTGSAYTCVDEVPPNGDTDYITSGTNTESSFAMSNTTGTAIAGTSSVKAVKAIATRKFTVGGSGGGPIEEV
jgi:hypothetical protein